MLFITALLMIGCTTFSTETVADTTSMESLPSWELPPPTVLQPNTLTVHLSDLVENRPLVATLDPMPAGVQRHELLMGTPGSTCVPELGGLCVDLANPVRLAPLVRARRGDTVTIPWQASFATGPILFQVAGIRGDIAASSNVVARTATLASSIDTGGDSGWDTGSGSCELPLTSTRTKDSVRTSTEAACTAGPFNPAGFGSCTDANGVLYDVFEIGGWFGARRWYFALDGTLVSEFSSTDCNCYCNNSFTKWKGLNLSSCSITWRRRC